MKTAVLISPRVGTGRDLDNHDAQVWREYPGTFYDHSDQPAIGIDERLKPNMMMVRAIVDDDVLAEIESAPAYYVLWSEDV